MKILLANKFYYPRGGDCICMIDLEALLKSKGHDVAIFAMQHPDNLESNYSSYWPSEVQFSGKDPIGLAKALARPFGVGEVKSRFKKLLQDFQPDIIHLHNIHSQLSPAIGQIAKKHNIPVVWTLHDYKLMCPAYTFMDKNGLICEECLTNSKGVTQKSCVKGSKLGSTLGYLEAKKWDKQTLASFTNCFVAPSFFMKKKMQEGGFLDTRIEHVYNFADTGKFENSVVVNRENYFVYLGRLSKEKGVETLLKSFKNQNKSSLKIIGDGPIRKDLENKFTSSNIEFLGYQQWENIKDILAKATALIIPSEWYENNPLTVIESLALGTPVLGANIGGIPELIEENANGFTFEAGNTESLITGIKKIILKEDWNYQDIQDNAKHMFSADKYYESIIQIYNDNII